MSKLLIAISNGFEEIEAVTIIDVCRRANIEVTIVSIDNIELVGAHNIIIKADKLLDEVSEKEFDMIALPGGLPNAFNLAQCEELQNLLKEFKKNDKKIGAICAAPYALHTADVLGDEYTCYPSFEKKIKEEGYIATKSVVIDNNILTSRGPATAMEFALEIVSMLEGKESKENLEKDLLLK